MNLLDELAGLILIWLALSDVFQSVIVPRAASRRLRTSSALTRGLWQVWQRAAWRIGDDDRRENALSTFAPFMMVTLLAAWVVMLIVGYGLIFYGLRAELHPQPISFWTALYFAGSSLLTIGYGDVVAVHGISRMIALLAGASGLGVVAVVTAYLFAIFGAFQRRETFIVTVGARAGAPPSGAGLLAIHGLSKIRDELNALFRDAQSWSAEAMGNILAYPILAHFRSSHDYESWVGTLGTLLDAAVLLMTTVDEHQAGQVGQARIFYGVGNHAAHDLARYFGFMNDNPTPGVERNEFDQACARLRDSGYMLRDPETAWANFIALRSAYAAHLNAIARYLQIPPLQWIGDRSLISAPHIAEIISEKTVKMNTPQG
ncbi:MAG: potassium channel family protein [Candidatus Eremiobacteraeota bacterium]|nr:potassium channel family protein [Candidatus Eremiobacteraeota bacterium]